MKTFNEFLKEEKDVVWTRKDGEHDHRIKHIEGVGFMPEMDTEDGWKAIKKDGTLTKSSKEDKDLWLDTKEKAIQRVDDHLKK